MTCPDCERYKTSASMWRNKAYEASGHPLPWNVEELLEKAIEAWGDANPSVTPAPRKWVGLTDEEVEYIADSEYEETFVRLIEAKLKEKNT